MSRHYETHTLPSALRDLVEQELEPDEKLLWIGQPIPAFFVGIVSVLPLLMGFPSTAFSIFWIYSAIGMGAPLFFALFGIPFVLVGLSMLCSPLFTRRKLKNTIYAVTDKRAIILVKFFITAKISVWPVDMGALQCKEKSDGSGHILFSAYGFTNEKAPGMFPVSGFFNIPDVREMEQLLKTLAAQTTQETEEEPEPIDHHADLPILVQLESVPRDLSLAVRLYLRLCSFFLPLLGWIFAGVGFAIILGAVSQFGKEDIGGILAFSGFGLVFVVGGLGFVIYSWLTGGKSIRLLQNGVATQAKRFATNPTCMTVNSKRVIKVDFQYQVEGKTYTASARAVDISRLTDTKYKVVLYDPLQPSRSIVLDGLPRGIRFDEWTNQFRVNPLRFVLPLLAATIVAGEVIAIIVAAILAMG